MPVDLRSRLRQWAFWVLAMLYFFLVSPVPPHLPALGSWSTCVLKAQCKDPVPWDSKHRHRGQCKSAESCSVFFPPSKWSHLHVLANRYSFQRPLRAGVGWTPRENLRARLEKPQHGFKDPNRNSNPGFW